MEENNNKETYIIDSIPQGEKPFVQLVGQDGNAYSIMARIRKAWRKRQDIVEEYTKRAMSGDYNNLLAVSLEYINEGEEQCQE